MTAQHVCPVCGRMVGEYHEQCASLSCLPSRLALDEPAPPDFFDVWVASIEDEDDA